MGDQSTRPPAEELFGSFFSGKTRRVFPFLLIFFSLIIFLAWLIRYPDVISIRVMIRQEQGVHRYFAAAPGRIGGVVAENDQALDSGAVLIAWEHSGSWQDVLALGALHEPLTKAEILRVDRLSLGSLEGDWVLARAAWESWQAAGQTARAAALAAPIGRQLAQLEQMEGSLRQKAEILAREVELAETTLKRYQRLAVEKTTSEESLAKAEAAWLEKKAQAESVGLEFRQVSLRKEDLEKELLTYSLADSEAWRDKKAQWQTAWGLLMARQEEWVQRHLLMAGQAGRIVFSRPLQAGQWVDEGEPLLALRSEEDDTAYVAKGWLPAANAGRVKPGSEVQLRLDAFPYEEFGAVKGRLSGMSPLAENESYLVEIEIPDSLITVTGRRLSTGPEAPATARILTSRKRLLTRVWEGIKRL